MEIYFRAKRFECKRSASASGRQQGKTMKDPECGPLNPWRSTDPKNQSLGDLSWLLSILEYVKPYLILGWMPVSWCCLWRLQWLPFQRAGFQGVTLSRQVWVVARIDSSCEDFSWLTKNLVTLHLQRILYCHVWLPDGILIGSDGF
jgi:hypothetical protein